MTELIALLTVAFSVYVVYEVFKTVSQADQAQMVKREAVKPAAAAAASPAASRPSAPADKAPLATPIEAKTIILRNPATGETTALPSNYRFAKKWVKEILVAEGLLDKVYKNSELKDAINIKVKDALEKLGRLEKYHA